MRGSPLQESCCNRFEAADVRFADGPGMFINSTVSDKGMFRIEYTVLSMKKTLIISCQRAVSCACSSPLPQEISIRKRKSPFTEEQVRKTLSACPQFLIPADTGSPPPGIQRKEQVYVRWIAEEEEYRCRKQKDRKSVV